LLVSKKVGKKAAGSPQIGPWWGDSAESKKQYWVGRDRGDKDETHEGVAKECEGKSPPSNPE